MKRFLSLILALALVLVCTPVVPLQANAARSGYYTYTVSNGEATIIDYDRAISGDIVIPDTLGGYPVTRIDYCAFQNCSSLTSVVIPDSVEIIDAYAFAGCSLKSVTIGNGVTSIGSDAFSWCENLTGIWVDANNPNYSSDEYGVLFNKDQTTLIKAPGGITGIYTIPDSVTSILYEAFWHCSSLTSVAIPDSVTSIGDFAFKYCDSLTSVTIGSGVTSIGDSAFSDCSSLTSVTIGSGVTSIGDSAFYWCSSLTSIVIPDSVTSIGDFAFKYCDSLTSVTIGNGVTSIGSYAFEDCSSLTGIWVDANNPNYSSDEYGVLFNKGKMTLIQAPDGITGSYMIPDSIESIGDSAFSDCDSLTSVTIGSGVTSIGDDAFRSCSSLTSVVIGDSVTSIGSDAFSYCSSLTSVVIPDSVTSIGGSAFECCDSLTSVTIGSGVTSIGYSAFSHCSSLTSVVIPNSVTSIGDYAFLNCSSLTGIWVDANNPNYSSDEYGVLFNKDKTTLTQAPDGITGSYMIPDSVTGIGFDAFSDCSSLESVVIPDSVTSIGDFAFSWCLNLTSVTIGNGVTSMGECAFSGCSSLTSVVIPDSVTSIGDSAFSYCSKLTDVYYSGTEEQWNKISIESYNGDLTDATIHYNSTGPHKHTYEAVVTAPSCTEGGYTTYTCACGDSYISDYVVTIDHDYEFCHREDPSCTAGFVHYICADCGADYGETIPATGEHSYDLRDWVDPTCTEGGFREYHCMVCGDSYRETIPATGEHSYYLHDWADPTCAEYGYKAYYCVGCYDSYHETIPATGEHSYFISYWEEPTCIKDGYKEYRCRECLGAAYCETIPAIGEHSYDLCDWVDPTCTEGGFREYHCMVCGDSYRETIPATDHSYDAVVIAPTCTADGYTTYTCDCGDSYIADYVAADHSYGQWMAEVPAQVGKAGVKGYYFCEACGKYFDRSKNEVMYEELIIPAAGEDAPQIVLESKTVLTGTEFTVAVEIKNNPGISYLEVTPVIPAQFTLEDVQNGELISDFTKGNQYIWIADENSTEDGLLMTFTFRVEEDVEPGEYEVSFQVRNCGNYQEEAVTLYLNAGKITVIDFIYGDANGDDVVDGFDVIRLARYMAGYDYETDTASVEICPGADANGDGKVDGFDIIRLKKYLANYDYETGESTIVLGQ